MSDYSVVDAINSQTNKTVAKYTNLKTGSIATERKNNTYDIKVMGDKTFVIPSVKPMNSDKTYQVNDNVLIGIPVGYDGLQRIIDRSNIDIPDEVEHHFRTKAAAGNLYLACTDGTIKPYGLNGTAKTSINTGQSPVSYLATDGTYIYAGGNQAYNLQKVKPDGTGYVNIIIQSRYQTAAGLGISPDGNYLYTVVAS